MTVTPRGGAGSVSVMTVHTFYGDDGSPCYLDDDPLVLPEGATEADRLRAWELESAATAFWLLFPER